MVFLEAVKGESFFALTSYVVVVLVAHVFRLRRLDELSALGITVGALMGFGLAVQFGIRSFWQPILMGLSVGLFGFLFRLLKTKLPLERAA
jgi:hypothetical protein